MSRFYHAILVDGQLHWLDDVPESLRRGTKEVQVRVTIEKQDNGDDEVNSHLSSMNLRRQIPSVTLTTR